MLPRGFADELVVRVFRGDKRRDGFESGRDHRRRRRQPLVDRLRLHLVRKDNRHRREHNIAHRSSTPISAPSIGSRACLSAAVTFAAFAFASRPEVIGRHIGGVDQHRAVYSRSNRKAAAVTTSRLGYSRTGRSSAARSHDARSAAREYVLSRKDRSVASESFAD